jgi:hypothetical protein
VENLLLSDLASANTSGMGRLGRGDLALSIGVRDSLLLTLSEELRLGGSGGASKAGISLLGKGDGLEHTRCSLMLCSSGWKENSRGPGLSSFGT